MRRKEDKLEIVIGKKTGVLISVQENQKIFTLPPLKGCKLIFNGEEKYHSKGRLKRKRHQRYNSLVEKFLETSVVVSVQITMSPTLFFYSLQNCVTCSLLVTS